MCINRYRKLITRRLPEEQWVRPKEHILYDLTCHFVCYLSPLQENQQLAYVKTKAQISCAVTAQLISAFVFTTRIAQFLFFLNLKFPLARFCDYTGQFVLDQVRNLNHWLSLAKAHLLVSLCCASLSNV